MDEVLKKRYEEKVGELEGQIAMLRTVARGRAERLRFLEVELRRMIADREYVVPADG